jgi:1-aminocyclopropane-1-carboxylate deaminase/D-cysteine desulfhydrase-like pyridoxal-dependent ACC family enzyme
VTTLAERWTGLAALPRVAIAALPTPVERLAQVSESTGAEVWVKRDDVTSPLYGGNKVRKLEYLLGDARAKGADTLITVGAVGSHHVLATSLFGAREGFDVHAVLGPQPAGPQVLEYARCDVAAGATLHPVPSFALVPFAVKALALRLRLRGRTPYIIPGGGSSEVGALGYVEAGIELAAQLEARALPEPRAIHLAFGTGGTVAGAAVGLAACGVTSEIVAVRVTEPALANRLVLRRLIHKLVALLRKLDRRFPDIAELALGRIRIEARELGAGYGVPTDTARFADGLGRVDGLTLETTYTAKALAGLVRDAAARPPRTPLLYWHTLSSADLRPLLARAPESLPRAVLALAR